MVFRLSAQVDVAACRCSTVACSKNVVFVIVVIVALEGCYKCGRLSLSPSVF